MNRFAAIVVLGLGTSTAALAAPLTSDNFSLSYTTANTTNVAGTPTITNALQTPISGTLAVGQTTTPTDFLVVSPTHGSGLVTGSIVVDFSVADGLASAITGVSNTVGANAVSIVNGKIQVDANYAINYASQTDCITWAGSCTPDSKAGAIKSSLSNTILVSFADGAGLDINLYNWSDWDMQPDISFGMVSTAPITTVPEPASFALFGVGLAGLVMMKRRSVA